MDCSLESALELARRGFYVVPIPKNKKKPVIKNWIECAANDPEKIKELWKTPPETKFPMQRPFNIGISMKTFNGGEHYLMALDVDMKNGNNGFAELLKWELEEKFLPITYSQKTPTNGGHYILRTKIPLRNSVCSLAPGIDVRGVVGQVLGAGSVIDGKPYTITKDVEPAWAPDWLVNLCNQIKAKEPPISSVISLDRERAVRTASYYLENEAEVAIQGAGGATTTYRVAATLKDFGLSEEDAFDLMAGDWNDACIPPWPLDELKNQVECAYRYGLRARGSLAPEASFDKIEQPPPAVQPPDTTFVEELNKSYAFCINGSKHLVLWETFDVKDEPYTHWLNLDTFHQSLSWWKINVGTEERPKKIPVSKLWLDSADKRWYQGLCFKPYTLGKSDPAANKKFYNLFKGFPLLPYPEGEEISSHAREAFEAYKEHAFENIALKNQEHYDFLMGFFAHMFQFPEIKPHSSIVIRGKEGTGKNAFIDRIGKELLANRYYLETAKERYLTGQFTDHLENLLLFCLTEAFWSGEKKADGILRDLITSDTHLIEHKFGDTFKVENRTRIVIIGNNKWVVPAALDARRWAVYDVGEGKVNNKKFFAWMENGMKAGGNRLLMDYFLKFDLSKIDVNNPPRTSALLNQKYSTMGSFYQWWLDCLLEGRMVCADYISDTWMTDVPKEIARNAYRRFTQERNVRSQIETSYRAFGDLLKEVCPSVDGSQKTKDAQGNYVNCYRVPDLDICRQMWEQSMGQEIKW